MDQFDPRGNVLQRILKGAQAGLADNLKQKYGTPNLEANAKQPVPGAEGVDGEEAPAEEEDIEGTLERMLSGQ